MTIKMILCLASNNNTLPSVIKVPTSKATKKKKRALIKEKHLVLQNSLDTRTRIMQMVDQNKITIASSNKEGHPIDFLSQVYKDWHQLE